MPKNSPISVRMPGEEIDEVENAVTFLRLGGRNQATGRQWSREAFIHYAIQRTIAELKDAAAASWPKSKK